MKMKEKIKFLKKFNPIYKKIKKEKRYIEIIPRNLVSGEMDEFLEVKLMGDKKYPEYGYKSYYINERINKLLDIEINAISYCKFLRETNTENYCPKCNSIHGGFEKQIN